MASRTYVPVYGSLPAEPERGDEDGADDRLDEARDVRGAVLGVGAADRALERWEDAPRPSAYMYRAAQLWKAMPQASEPVIISHCMTSTAQWPT
ncbi:hypothetical protein [Streptomyces sp. S1D4-20]|uniref:hypothetical protein n=1 Tax=Streptomyces sp. S1D4-20 TaxID=2594462 RepID=UPI001F071F90|nr:hypothetical protein [Streptomyces sp. S1D4-20]